MKGHRVTSFNSVQLAFPRSPFSVGEIIMAKLTKDQESAVAQWAAEGATLNEIQGRLKQEFGVVLTYLDARLLVIDLGLNLQEKKKEKEKVEPEATSPAASAPTDAGAEAEGWGDDEAQSAEADLLPPEPGMGASNVHVQVDQIAVPGSMVSGRVTFSDGKTAIWYLDQHGRLGMKAPEAGYKPSPADIQTFQMQLDIALQKAGY